MNKDKKRNGDTPAPLDTILSLFRYTHLEKYGGETGLQGFPLCYWLRCLTGKAKADPHHCSDKIPAPEVRYFSQAEHGYLVQALLALCCFFDRRRPGKKYNAEHTFPFVVKRAKKNPCHEFLFLKTDTAGAELVAVVDTLRLHRLAYLHDTCFKIDIVVVYLQNRYACHAGRLPDSLFSISFLDESGSRYHDDTDRLRVKKIRVHRLVPVPANELLNGLFRLRKVNEIRQARNRELLPEKLGVMLLPFLYWQRKRLRRLPTHRARITEI